jgi:hypothetical protein
MKKRFYPLWFLIICNILLVIGTLYITRHAIDDFEYTVFSQRNHYKTNAITKMANFYYHSPEFKKENGIGLGKFLTRTATDEDEGYFLFKWEPKKGFPILYIGGNKTFQKYYNADNFIKAIDLSDSLKIINKSQFNELLFKLYSYQTTNDLSPTIITQRNGLRYLLTWVIIPAPNSKDAEFLCLVFTPTTTIDDLVASTKLRYIWLFSGATALSGIMLVLIPLVLRKFSK